MRRSLFHPFSGDCPNGALKVDLIPSCMSKLAFSDKSQHEQLSRSLDRQICSDLVKGIQGFSNFLGGQIAFSRFESCDGTRLDFGGWIFDFFSSKPRPFENLQDNVTYVNGVRRSATSDEFVAQSPNVGFGDF